MNDKGAASIEAAIALPVFLFTVLAFIYMAEIHTVRGVVYEGVIETAEYMAEYAYLSDCIDGAGTIGLPMAYLKFSEYVDDKALLEKYIVGGSSGVMFIGSSFPDEDGYIDLWVNYYVHVDVPFISSLSQLVTEHVRQRAYLGRREDISSEEGQEDDRYVYVAENGVVYHETRSCTYLLPDIKAESLSEAKADGYKACNYCGGGSTDVVIVTDDGEKYHSSVSCSRLRRTVERKKLSEVDLPPCSKCGE